MDEESSPSLTTRGNTAGPVSAAQAIANAALTEALTTQQQQTQAKSTNTDDRVVDGSTAETETTHTGQDEGGEEDSAKKHSSLPSHRSSSGVLKLKRSHVSRVGGYEDDDDDSPSTLRGLINNSDYKDGDPLVQKLKEIWRFIDDHGDEDVHDVDPHQLFQQAYESTLTLFFDGLDSITQEFQC